MPILPPPPRATSAARLAKKLTGAAFIALIGLAMLAGMGWYATRLAQSLMDDRDLSARGVPAVDGRTEGTSRTRRLMFHEYKLTLSYTDERGARHTAHQEFDTILGEVDQHAHSEIRYDPAHPERAASSWAVDVAASRAAWAAIVAAMSALGAFVVYAAGRSVRDAFWEKETAREGQEVRVRLTELSRDQYGNATCAMSAEVGPGQTVTDRVVLNKKSPWRLGGDDALGLYSLRRGRIFLVESDGQPVVLDDAELMQARGRDA